MESPKEREERRKRVLHERLYGVPPEEPVTKRPKRKKSAHRMREEAESSEAIEAEPEAEGTEGEPEAED